MISYGIAPSVDPTRAYAFVRYNGFDKLYPRINEILSASSKTMDHTARTKLFEEAHALTCEGVPGIIFYQYDYVNAYWKYVKGYKNWSNQPRFWGVWLDK